MRRFAAVAFVAALMVPVGLGVSPAGALPFGSDMWCSSVNSTLTYSPGLPIIGDPTKVTATVTQTSTIAGCVGLGITGGTETFTGTTAGPVNCQTSVSTGVSIVGTSTTLWSNGQTSISTNQQSIDNGVTMSSGLFAGASVGPLAVGGSVTFNQNACFTAPLTNLNTIGDDLAVFLPPVAPVGCTSSQVCDTTRSASASATAPGLAVTVTGAPAAGKGTVALNIASGKLACPKVAPNIRPVANVTDTGFKPSEKLLVTAALPLASSTSTELVCFNSAVPFKSQSNPTVATAGTAFLLDCTQTANVAPCVTSSKQVGSNVVVKFVLPGGDPHFCIVTPKGRQAFLLHYGTGTVGKPYSTHMETTGGIGAVHWAVLSGNLPKGVTLNASTGAISGRPTTKGSSTVVLQATDSQGKKTSPLPVPFTVT